MTNLFKQGYLLIASLPETVDLLLIGTLLIITAVGLRWFLRGTDANPDRQSLRTIRHGESNPESLMESSEASLNGADKAIG